MIPTANAAAMRGSRLHSTLNYAMAAAAGVAVANIYYN